MTLPFVVRTVQPVLSELDPAEEEAAHVLGAARLDDLQAGRPAGACGLRSRPGALLAFARALGEFGAVVIIAGNITGKTLTAPVFIFQLTSQFRRRAAAVATVLFAISFVLVLVTERLIGRKGKVQMSTATERLYGRRRQAAGCAWRCIAARARSTSVYLLLAPTVGIIWHLIGEGWTQRHARPSRYPTSATPSG